MVGTCAQATPPIPMPSSMPGPSPLNITFFPLRLRAQVTKTKLPEKALLPVRTRPRGRADPGAGDRTGANSALTCAEAARGTEICGELDEWQHRALVTYASKRRRRRRL